MMSEESLLEAQKVILKQFPDKITNKLDGQELAYNIYRFLENYNEHLKVLMEYESNKKKLSMQSDRGNKL